MVSLCPQLPWVESQAKFNQFRSSPINLDWFSPPLQLQKVQEALYQATLVSHESAKLTQTSYRLLGAAADADHMASTVRPCAGHVPYAPAPSQYAHFVLLSTGLVSAAVLCTPRTHGPPLSNICFPIDFYFTFLSCPSQNALNLAKNVMKPGLTASAALAAKQFSQIFSVSMATFDESVDVAHDGVLTLILDVVINGRRTRAAPFKVDLRDLWNAAKTIADVAFPGVASTLV